MTIIIWDGKSLTADRLRTKRTRLKNTMNKHTIVDKIFDLRESAKGFIGCCDIDGKVTAKEKLIAIAYSGPVHESEAFHSFLLSVSEEERNIFDDIYRWVKHTPNGLTLSFILVAWSENDNKYKAYTIHYKDRYFNGTYTANFGQIHLDFYTIGCGGPVIDPWQKTQSNLSTIDYIYLASLFHESCGGGYSFFDLKSKKIKNMHTFPTNVKQRLLDSFKTDLLKMK